MLPGAKRRARITAAAASSVWESRMKMDEVKGGIKVFNATAADEEGGRVHRRLRRNQSDAAVGASPPSSPADAAERKKRRNWKPPEPVAVNAAADRSPPSLRKTRSEISRVATDEEEEEEEEDDEIEIDVKSFDDKEIVVAVVEDEKKADEMDEIPVLPVIEEQKDPAMDLKQTLDLDLETDTVKQNPVEVEDVSMEMGSETQNRLQNIVNLVMWRDISRSAFVFGSGSFLLLSSSYARDLDFSLISAVSYMGLFYLALIFLFKSILRRGAMECDEREEERSIIGEEEAIWALRFVLPYINEVLIKIKALFSGDPATTMKLAVLLFVFARCGGSITLWTLARILFFGLFTVPKLLSSYSLQLARYGKFWLDRFRDGWESCGHKKAVAAAIFTLIWNMSSTIARIWSVFMLVVALKLYQQCRAEWDGDELMQQEEEGEEEEEEEEKVITTEEERREDSKASAQLSPASATNNSNDNNNNRNYRLQQRQRNGPRRATAGKEREAAKVKKWT